VLYGLVVIVGLRVSKCPGLQLARNTIDSILRCQLPALIQLPLTGHATQPPLARFASDGRDAPCLHEEKTHTTKDALKFVIGRPPLPPRQTWPKYNACVAFCEAYCLILQLLYTRGVLHSCLAYLFGNAAVFLFTVGMIHGMLTSKWHCDRATLTYKLQHMIANPSRRSGSP
jgi:hypothetical protein